MDQTLSSACAQHAPSTDATASVLALQPRLSLPVGGMGEVFQVKRYSLALPSTKHQRQDQHARQMGPGCAQSPSESQVMEMVHVK